MKTIKRIFSTIAILCIAQIFVLAQNESIGLNLSQMHSDIFTLEWRRVVSKTTLDVQVLSNSGASQSRSIMFDNDRRIIDLRSLSDPQCISQNTLLTFNSNALVPPNKRGFKKGFIIGSIAGGIIGLVAGGVIGKNVADGSNHALDAALPLGFGILGGVGGALLGGVLGGTISYSF